MHVARRGCSVSVCVLGRGGSNARVQLVRAGELTCTVLVTHGSLSALYSMHL